MALGMLMIPHAIVNASKSRTKTTVAARSFIPVVLYQGEFHPVVGVKKKKPLIEVDGKLIKVPSKTSVFFWSKNAAKPATLLTGRNVTRIDTGVGHGLAGANFQGGSMGAGGGLGPTTPGNTDQGLEGNQISRDENKGSADNDQSQAWENITSTDGSLHNAYGVFIFYSDRGIAELKWRNVKNTPEGKVRAMRIPYASRKTLRDHKNPSYMFLVFQNAEELVPSDQPGRNGFLSWNETSSMALLAKKHKETSKQQTVEPSLIFRPDSTLSKSAHEHLKDKEISASITINKLGMVSDVYLDSDIDPSTANEVLDWIRLWKFLPAIEEGKQMEKEVVVPLQF